MRKFKEEKNQADLLKASEAFVSAVEISPSRKNQENLMRFKKVKYLLSQEEQKTRKDDFVGYLNDGEAEKFLKKTFYEAELKPPQPFICNIELEIMRNPCLTETGYSYEQNTLMDYFEQ